MEKVRLGIVGLGNMGRYHGEYLMKGEVKEVVLTAVCDIKPSQLDWVGVNYGESIARFDGMDAMLASGLVDAVLIATPHYDHPTLAVQAFGKGMHVLVEKPAGVYTQAVRIMNQTAEASGRVFGIMYNQRANPLYQKLRDLVQSGELGALKRTNWIITSWYRPQSYFNSGGWRATWEGEGGGVLLNQDPHQLDLWQWTCGMPKRVRAFCYFGKYHDIEVEDDVTAFVEYENGATGVFVTSTGDAPGTNRLEVTGDMGKVVIENEKLVFTRNRVSERDFNRDFRGGFGEPECWTCDVPVPKGEHQYPVITRSWAKAILQGTPMLAPGVEGIRGLSISNAIHLSAWTDSWIDLAHLDEDLFLAKLQERISTSTVRKNVGDVRTLDVHGTNK
jgi:predicted dehydrogenase